MSAIHIEALRQRLRALGARPSHEERMLRQWARAESQTLGKRRVEDFLPLALRTALPALEAELRALAVLRADHAGADGSRRLLVGLADGRSVEAVLLPRGGLCVSSQVGCAVGCVFCMTGIGGLERQLGSAEIVAQVVLARGLRPVTKVVFMGMGEPAHNLDAVLEAIDLLGTGGGLGHKQLVFSTVGDRRAFERLPQGRVKPALALSLHSADAARPGEDTLVHLGSMARVLTGALELQATLETVRGAERALEMALAGTASARGLEEVVSSLLDLRERLALMRGRPGAPAWFIEEFARLAPSLATALQAGRSLLAFSKGEIQQDTIYLDELLSEVAADRASVQLSPGAEAVWGDQALVRLALRAMVEQVRGTAEGGTLEIRATPTPGKVQLSVGLVGAPPGGPAMAKASGLGLGVVRRIAEPVSYTHLTLPTKA